VVRGQWHFLEALRVLSSGERHARGGSRRTPGVSARDAGPRGVEYRPSAQRLYEVETIHRVRSDNRDRSPEAMRKLIDDL